MTRWRQRAPPKFLRGSWSVEERAEVGEKVVSQSPANPGAQCALFTVNQVWLVID